MEELYKNIFSLRKFSWSKSCFNVDLINKIRRNKRLKATKALLHSSKPQYLRLRFAELLYRFVHALHTSVLIPL